MPEQLLPPAVLIVDSEPYVCRVFEAKLTRDNQFRVHCSLNVTDAIHAATSQPFDILLWDVYMRDTRHLLPRLRALCPEAALVLLTTDDRPTIDPEILRLDVSDVLVKPISLDTLIERVRHAHVAQPLTTTTARVDLACVGQLVTIQSALGVCSTRVLESWQDMFTVVGSPRIETPPDFAPGLPVRVYLRGEDALYSFASRLLRSEERPIPCWNLEMPHLIRREQRRRFHRVSTHLPVLLKTEHRGFELPERAEGLTSNLSLGGCALVSEQDLPVGSDVRFDMRTGENEVSGEGKVVYALPLPMYDTAGQEIPRRYRISIEFTTLDPSSTSRLQSILRSDSVM